MKRILFLFLSVLFYISCEDPRKYEHVDGDNAPLPVLHAAVDKNEIEKVTEILSLEECGADKSKTAENGSCSDVNWESTTRGGRQRTAIFYVKSRKMLELIVSKGAEVKVNDIQGYTPLHFADNPEVADYFLDKGLDIEAKNVSGYTPLYRAIKDERYETARFLFEQGANPNAETNIKNTPLEEARSQSSKKTVKLNKLIKDFESYKP